MNHNKQKLQRKGKLRNFDAQTVASNKYNDYAGGGKSLDVGPKLIPIRLESGWTTDATTARQLVAGAQLAIYNNSTTLYSVRFGQTSAVAAGAAGTVDANGNVAIACEPGTWTQLANAEDTWVIAENAALIVYIIKDDTVLV